MNQPDPDSPTWNTVLALQRELAVADRAAPGSLRARDLENAIDRLVDGSHEADDPAYRRRNSVRRARFLAAQAARKQPAAVVRAGTACFPAARCGAHLRAPQAAENVPAPDDVEQLVLDLDMATRAEQATGGIPHGTAVLAALAAGAARHDVAGALGVSRSTVDRTARRLGERLRPLVAA